MIPITRYFYIHILLIPLIFVAFLTGSQMTFFISFGVVLIHELCHLLTALSLGVKVYSIIVMPFGMTVRLDSSVIKTPKKEVLIALAGPLSNAVMLYFGILFRNFYTSSFNFMLFCIINAAMLLLNSMPVPPLDGGRILRAIIIHNSGLISAARIIRRISVFFIAILLFFGILLLVIFRGNPSLIMIAAFLFYSLADEKKNSDLLIMREIILHKEKQYHKGLIPVKLLGIHQDTPAKQILKKMNFSNFFLIAILNDDMCILGFATETDFIKKVTEKGYGICAKDIF